MLDSHLCIEIKTPPSTAKRSNPVPSCDSSLSNTHGEEADYQHYAQLNYATSINYEFGAYCNDPAGAVRAASAVLPPGASVGASRVEAVTLKGSAALLGDPSLVHAVAQVAPRQIALDMAGPGTVELPPKGAREAPSVSALTLKGEQTTVKFAPERTVYRLDNSTSDAEGLAGWLSGLSWLYVTGTTLTTLENSGLGACTNLTSLVALGNAIQHLPVTELATLTNLQMLDLSENDLRSVQPLRLPQVSKGRVKAAAYALADTWASLLLPEPMLMCISYHMPSLRAWRPSSCSALTPSLPPAFCPTSSVVFASDKTQGSAVFLPICSRT